MYCEGKWFYDFTESTREWHRQVISRVLLAIDYSIQTLCPSVIFWPFLENDLWWESQLGGVATQWSKQIFDRVLAGDPFSGGIGSVLRFWAGFQPQEPLKQNPQKSHLREEITRRALASFLPSSQMDAPISKPFSCSFENRGKKEGNCLFLSRER